jgi:hypothetical protein
MQKWEYKVLGGWPSEARLNQLGQAGWELVSVAVDGGGEVPDVYVYLRRPISN